LQIAENVDTGFKVPTAAALAGDKLLPGRIWDGGYKYWPIVLTVPANLSTVVNRYSRRQLEGFLFNQAKRRIRTTLRLAIKEKSWQKTPSSESTESSPSNFESEPPSSD
jgi:hypothetical protein